MSDNKNIDMKDGHARYTAINCIATGLLAYFFTIPFHEFLHFITFYIYGHKAEYYSAGSVGPVYI